MLVVSFKDLLNYKNYSDEVKIIADELDDYLNNLETIPSGLKEIIICICDRWLEYYDETKEAIGKEKNDDQWYEFTINQFHNEYMVNDEYEEILNNKQWSNYLISKLFEEDIKAVKEIYESTEEEYLIEHSMYLLFCDLYKIMFRD